VQIELQREKGEVKSLQTQREDLQSKVAELTEQLRESKQLSDMAVRSRQTTVNELDAQSQNALAALKAELAESKLKQQHEQDLHRSGKD